VHVLSMSLRRQTVEQEAHPKENQSTQVADTADAESAPG
jgi:hypothetical protein